MKQLTASLINAVYEANMVIIFFVLLMAFVLLYFSVTGVIYGLSKWLVKIGKAEQIEKRPQFDNQIKFEIQHSFYSIGVFAVYGIFTIFLIRREVISISNEGGWMVFLHLLVLAFWNEIHFYICHRIMHHKKLIKYHSVHHKSVVVTPFSTYSFHPLESFILGSVMILPMFFYSIEFWALMMLPLYSLILNSIGHSNVSIVRAGADKSAYGMSKRHNKHHTKFNANFGFGSVLLDRLLKTRFHKK